jgi:hypothetical protein
VKGIIGGGGNALPIFFITKNNFSLLAVELKKAIKKWMRVGERGVCILRTGSKQSSPLSNLTPS